MKLYTEEPNTMTNTMTAIEWLVSQQKHNKFFDIETIEKAIQMEKEQSHYFYNQGVKDDYFIDYNNFIKEHYNWLSNKNK